MDNCNNLNPKTKFISQNVVSYIKYLLFLGLSIMIFSFCNYDKKENIPTEKIFKIAELQYSDMLLANIDMSKYPRSTKSDGALEFVNISNWTCGFWPGSLWYIHEYNKGGFWRENAIKWTKSLEKNQYNTSHHDLGFMMYNSYGNAYRITKDSTFLPILIQSAKSLIKRYSPTVGCIKSWDKKNSLNGKHSWKFPVIIDNMMNLELLFFASNQTKDPVYRNIAIKHAKTTMLNHIRPDYSTYHMVNYDEKTGKAIDHKTVQGFSDNSQWARGQAWAVYGFTTVYRETKDIKFLITAQKLAEFYLNNPRLPTDKIPYWDFNVGEKGFKPEWDFDRKQYNPIPRDASAAAIMASALIELSGYSEESLKVKYLNASETMLASLSSPQYLAKPGTNNHFILKNSVGHMPKKSEVNVPLIYADYYFLEALLRYKNL